VATHPGPQVKPGFCIRCGFRLHRSRQTGKLIFSTVQREGKRFKAHGYCVAPARADGYVEAKGKEK
jgi:hypothetical protein